jgi:hypothetical protein
MSSADISPCVLLRCRDRDYHLSVIAIPVVRRSELGSRTPAPAPSGREPYYRIGCGPPLRIPLAYLRYGTPTTINVAKHTISLTRGFGKAGGRTSSGGYDVALIFSPELAGYKLCDGSEEPWPIESGNAQWKHSISTTGAIAGLYDTAPHRQAGLFPRGAGALRFQSNNNKDHSLVVVLRATYAAVWERSIISFLKRFDLQILSFQLEAGAFLASKDDCPESAMDCLAALHKRGANGQARPSDVRCELDTTSAGCLGAYNVWISLGTPDKRNSIGARLAAFRAGWRPMALTPDHASVVFLSVFLLGLSTILIVKSSFHLEGAKPREHVLAGLQAVVPILYLALSLYTVFHVRRWRLPWASNSEMLINIMD